jgi:hypothetical protein
MCNNATGIGMSEVRYSALQPSLSLHLTQILGFFVLVSALRCSRSSGPMLSTRLNPCPMVNANEDPDLS